MVSWIYLARDRDKFWAFVNTTVKRFVPYNAGIPQLSEGVSAFQEIFYS
jgi:hypothetical protein